MLLKLDFYFFEVFAIQFLVLVLHTTDPEYALTIVIIILALPIVIFAIYAVRAAWAAYRRGWGELLLTERSPRWTSARSLRPPYGPVFCPMLRFGLKTTSWLHSGS